MFIVLQTVNGEAHEPTAFKKSEDADKLFEDCIKQNSIPDDKANTRTSSYFQLEDGNYTIEIFEIPFSSYQGEKLVRS